MLCRLYTVDYACEMCYVDCTMYTVQCNVTCVMCTVECSGGQCMQCSGDVYPGHDDEHAGGHVDGEQVVGELPLEHHQYLEGLS